jgi:GrpB-like predicted nucleotidyltransferase (UPF0157 family)
MPIGPPLTDEQIAAANVGPPLVLNSPIALEPYNPEWPAVYARLARDISTALGAKILLLEHVGSTAVPGLSAKPVIDIVLAVADSADENAYVKLLEAVGYVLKIREPDWFDHRLLKSAASDVNLHVFSHGCSEIGRMLAFRNWLRTHEDDLMLYQRIKQELGARTWRYMQNYADAKSAVVNEILGRAVRSSDHMNPILQE